MSICFAITDADWALTKDVFSIIGTIVSALGVGVAGWFGFQGLKTWRKQSKGTADHDLSRRMLIDLYRLRDSIGYVRNPAMFSDETEVSEESSEKLNLMQKLHKGKVQAYQKRFEKVDSVRGELSASLLESEAVWGGELKARFNTVFKLQHELWMNVRNYLIVSNPDEFDEKVEAYRKIMSKRRDVLYADPLEGEDDFKNELDSAIAYIEEYVRPKMIV